MAAEPALREQRPPCAVQVHCAHQATPTNAPQLLQGSFPVAGLHLRLHLTVPVVKRQHVTLLKVRFAVEQSMAKQKRCTL